MKTLLAAFILCLGWQASARAELSLSNRTDSTLTNPALRDLSMASVALPSVPDLAVPTSTWMGTGTTPTLTLDLPKAAPAIARLDLSLPVASGPGVPDSWIYAALGTMGLALAWACSGYVSRRHQQPAPLHTGGEHRAPRAPRVHMLPLDVDR